MDTDRVVTGISSRFLSQQREAGKYSDLNVEMYMDKANHDESTNT